MTVDFGIACRLCGKRGSPTRLPRVYAVAAASNVRGQTAALASALTSPRGVSTLRPSRAHGADYPATSPLLPGMFHNAPSEENP